MAPVVPELIGDTDTSCFDLIEDERDRPENFATPRVRGGGCVCLCVGVGVGVGVGVCGCGCGCVCVCECVCVCVVCARAYISVYIPAWILM